MEKRVKDVLYNDYGSYLYALFGTKVQKLPVDGGFTCPNRDGAKGRGGCSYCSNRAFHPSYAASCKSIRQQLEEGKRFFSRRVGGQDVSYLAYFQSYSNTYASCAVLNERYEEALSVDGVKGLVVSTRPDCLGADVLDCLSAWKRKTYLSVEVGIESLSDGTLQAIRRGHDVATARKAVEELASLGIPVVGHLILGLPGETRSDWLRQAHEISSWPLTGLKLHQLQIVKGTLMARQYAACPDAFDLFDVEAYVNLLAEYIVRLRPSLVLERFVSQMPPHSVLAPRWGLKPDRVQALLLQLMRERGWRQGLFFAE